MRLRVISETHRALSTSFMHVKQSPLNHIGKGARLWSSGSLFQPRVFPSTFFTSRQLTTTTSTPAPESDTTAAVDSQSLPTLPPPIVGHWLLACATLVFGIVVVGGVTRLTESGLSITEWKPITGILPPLNAAEWDEEFEKYKLTPEFKLWVPLFFFSFSFLFARLT